MNYIIIQNGIEIWKGNASDEFDALAKAGMEVFETDTSALIVLKKEKLK